MNYTIKLIVHYFFGVILWFCYLVLFMKMNPPKHKSGKPHKIN